MKNINIANKLILDLYKEWWLYQEIIPIIQDWLPVLAHYQLNWDREIYLFSIEGKRKFYLKIEIENWNTHTSTHPQYELRFRGSKHIDWILLKYQPYENPLESLKKFVLNDLPLLKDIERNKRISVICCTDPWQWNIGHITLDCDFFEFMKNSWLTITYSIELQK